MVKRVPRVVRPDDREGKATAAGGDIYADLATSDHTDSSYYLVHAIVPAGGGPPAHIHTREEEAFYVITGEVEFQVDGSTIVAPTGTFVNVPRGTKHQFRNASDAGAELIFWFTPAGIEGLFAELAQNPEEIIAIGEKYGVEYFLDE